MSDEPRWPVIHVIRQDHDPVTGNNFTSVVSSPVCDFCGDKGPVWDYDCADFKTEEDGSWGEWAACLECSEMIERHDLDALLARNMTGMDRLQLSDARRDATVARVTAMHAGFFANRIGERRAFG